MFKSYKDIFAAYVADLRVAREAALGWWAALKLEAGSNSETDPEEARVRPRWPAGAASHPRVLAVYRKYYLEIVKYDEWAVEVIEERKKAPAPLESSGQEQPGENYEATPSEILLEWLEGKAPDLDSFMTEMVMLPIADPLPDDAIRSPLGAPPARFKFAVRHRVPLGITRLMSQPRDLPPSAPWRDAAVAFSEASPLHRTLFLEYHRDLEVALRDAEKWWGGVIAHASPSFFSRKKDAVSAAYERFFAGPASSGEILGVIHRYWLECVELNTKSPERDRVPPEVLLLHWLLDGQHDSWVECITCMPYWPIGLDDKGGWV